MMFYADQELLKGFIKMLNLCKNFVDLWWKWIWMWNKMFSGFDQKMIESLSVVSCCIHKMK